MKLTTEQIKQIIKEELKAVLEGRTIYAPGPEHPYDPETGFERRPFQRGSDIVYDDEPADLNLLKPELRKAVAGGMLDKEQAKEFQSALGGSEENVDKYFYDHERVGSTELDVLIKQMQDKVNELRKQFYSMENGPARINVGHEMSELRNKLDDLQRVRRKSYERKADLGTDADVFPRRPLRRNK